MSWTWSLPAEGTDFHCNTEEADTAIFDCDINDSYPYYNLIISSSSDITFNGWNTEIFTVSGTSGSIYESVAIIKSTVGSAQFTATLYGMDTTATELESRTYWLYCYAPKPLPTYTLGTPASGLKYKAQTAQQLLTSGGSCSGGTLYYGLGSSTSSAPSYWYESTNYANIKGTNVGNYYIWYKIQGDSSHKSVAQQYWTTVAIAEAPQSNIYAKTESGFKLVIPYTLTAVNGATYVWQQCSGYVKQEDGWHQLN